MPPGQYEVTHETSYGGENIAPCKSRDKNDEARKSVQQGGLNEDPA